MSLRKGVGRGALKVTKHDIGGARVVGYCQKSGVTHSKFLHQFFQELSFSTSVSYEHDTATVSNKHIHKAISVSEIALLPDKKHHNSTILLM